MWTVRFAELHRVVGTNTNGGMSRPRFPDPAGPWRRRAQGAAGYRALSVVTPRLPASDQTNGHPDGWPTASRPGIVHCVVDRFAAWAVAIPSRKIRPRRFDR